MKLEAHHSNITAPEFNIDWFQQFNLVFNALDNLEARRHVNKMCLAAEVPLIESGTTGFNGQVQVIKKVKSCSRFKGTISDFARAKLNAMIAILRKYRRLFLSARYGAHPVSQSTALFGQRAIFSLRYLA